LCLFCAIFYPAILDKLRDLCYNKDTKKENKREITTMTTYYIARNKQGEIEEVFVDAITAYYYCKDTGFTLEKIQG
jgi:hypothetical protein